MHEAEYDGYVVIFGGDILWRFKKQMDSWKKKQQQQQQQNRKWWG